MRSVAERQAEAEKVDREFQSRGLYLQGSWEAFRIISLEDTTLTEKDVENLRRIFFAGSMGMYSLLLKHGEDHDVQEAIQQEVCSFALQFVKGIKPVVTH